MYTLKSIARRSVALGMATAMVAAAVMPAASVFAQQFALNPLTERSLLLSSSAPGYVDTDGSGYSTTNPNPAADPPGTPTSYAPAGSGPNGKKSGQTFSFRLSTGGTHKGFSFQYCTSAAGNCQAPGNNGGDARDGVKTAPAYASPNTYDGNGALDNNADGREDNTLAHPESRSDLDFVGTFVPAGVAANVAAMAPGQFQIFRSADGTAWTAVDTSDWEFEKANLEDTAHTGPMSGKNNYVTLSDTEDDGITGLNAGDYIKIVFKPAETGGAGTGYITNPGAGHFFVKINTYSNVGIENMVGNHNNARAGYGGWTSGDPVDGTVIDGGVTVANVMTDSIHITTKVLETMSFSVGIKNPDTILHEYDDDSDPGTPDVPNPGAHGTCEIMSQTDPATGLTNNRLNLGNPNAEYSLETTKAWDVFSYWRLSSNSSGGATVYYSGNTLANTVGDEIKAIDGGTPAASLPGTEQFGLGFVDVSSGAHADTFSGSFNAAVASGSYAHTNPRSFPFITVTAQEGVGDYATLAAQPVSAHYRLATGSIDNGSGGAGTAQFKFLPSSLTVPEPIAQQSETVISCATAKMRYVGNIAADTPAGVYTTKVNYLAAPQY